jgi:hypothetical protein
MSSSQDLREQKYLLGIAYQDNGQTTEAVETLEHVVKVQEKPAEDHPSLLSLLQHELTRGNLSVTSRLLSRAYGRPAQVIAARAAERAG